MVYLRAYEVLNKFIDFITISAISNYDTYIYIYNYNPDYDTFEF